MVTVQYILADHLTTTFLWQLPDKFNLLSSAAIGILYDVVLFCCKCIWPFIFVGPFVFMTCDIMKKQILFWPGKYHRMHIGIGNKQHLGE